MAANAATSAVLGSALVALLACSACNEAPRGATRTTAPTVVTSTATDYAFDAPDTIAAGFTTFRLLNHSDQLHTAQLIRLEEGKTLDDFLVAYEKAFRTTGPRPPWAPRLGGPGVADPHAESNATHHLEPGSYAWICLMDVPDGIPHVVKAKMAKHFTVRDRSQETATAVAPNATITIQLEDYSFRISGPLGAGRHVFRVQNTGAEPHEIGLVRLAAAKTMQDFKAWMQNPRGPPPASSVGGIASMAPSATASCFEAEVTSGEYLLLCFVTAPDGRPHTDHGMIQHLRVE